MAQQIPHDISLAGEKVGQYPHICAFFHSQDEEYELLLPFIKEGVERGERAFHIVDPKLREDHLKRLREGGLNAEDLMQKSQLEVRTWEGAYLRSEGRFDQHDMLELIQEVLGVSGKDFPLTRLIAHMEWALEEALGVDDLIEYEARLNLVLPKFHDPVICIYDLGRFSAGTVVDVMRTHPMVILGGALHENPFYVPTEQFLIELRARKVAQAKL